MSKILNIIYSLSSPIDGRVYYVGQSQKGLDRPYSHFNCSYSPKLKEWFRSLPNEPIVSIIERHDDINLLNERERYWINEMVRRGEPLINKVIPNERQLKYADYRVCDFIKEMRRSVKLTQPEFAKKAGVGLRFVRDLEQGKETMRIDKVLQVMQMFGATLIPVVKNV